MKASQNALFFTKSKLVNVLSALLLGFGLFSCTENEDNPTPNADLDTEEVSAVVEGALVYSTDGVTMAMEEAAYLTVLPISCGESNDSTLTRNIDNQFASASYQMDWDWSLTCNGFIPSSLSFMRSTEGTYETQRMSSDDSASGSWSVSEFFESDEIKVEGQYTRTGQQSSKIRNQSNFISTIDLTQASFRVNKTTGRITSGTATYTVSGTLNPGTEDEVSYSYTGEIVFLGDGRATMTINGEIFYIDLYN